ncbi:hypothetical protein PO909_019271 [Leuciscus waleckii]
MYSGLLPPGLTEADLSSDDDDDEEGVTLTSENRQVQTDEHLSLQSGTEPHPICLQDECNTTKTDLHNYDASGDECLPGVSLDNWQRFKDLQRAKDDQRMKQPQTKRQRKRRHKKGGTQNCDTKQKREPEEKQEEHWKELTQYFGINDRLKPPPCSRPPLMSGLEKSIESAIAEGDYGKAEELSDSLATREVDRDITVSLETILGNISSLHGLHCDATRLYQPLPLFFCLVENGRFKHSFTESLSRLQKQQPLWQSVIYYTTPSRHCTSVDLTHLVAPRCSYRAEQKVFIPRRPFKVSLLCHVYRFPSAIALAPIPLKRASPKTPWCELSASRSALNTGMITHYNFPLCAVLLENMIYGS